MSKRSRRGFSLVELMVALVCMSLIAGLAFPYAELVLQRRKEADLRLALREIRSAIDAYHRAAEEGRIARLAGDSGYPPSLEILVDGVKDVTSPHGNQLYFLRRIPGDPFNPDPTIPAARSWARRSYDSPAAAPREGKDVYDIFSRSTALGINGTPYRDW